MQDLIALQSAKTQKFLPDFNLILSSCLPLYYIIIVSLKKTLKKFNPCTYYPHYNILSKVQIPPFLVMAGFLFHIFLLYLRFTTRKGPPLKAGLYIFASTSEAAPNLIYKVSFTNQPATILQP